MLSAKKDSFVSFFPICTCFISFTYRIVLAKFSRTTLKNTGERESLCLFLGLVGKLLVADH